ncbi:hypothetical protein HY968_03600 [Candidatus Kaiserbacteria bacterium]|nr:hypothetical protein [Candidatus Kaiserbacteria bacterium]
MDTGELKHAKEEGMPQVERIYHRYGKWYMRIDDKCRGVELPEDIARKMHESLVMTSQFAKARYRDAYFDSLYSRQCHGTVLFALGLATKEDLDRAHHTFDMGIIPQNELRNYTNETDLVAHMRATLGNKLGYGYQQIGSMRLSGRNVRAGSHSFIVGVDELGRVICYDKFAVESAGVNELSNFWKYEEARAGTWACVPIEKILGDEKLRARIQKELRASYDLPPRAS